MAIDGKITDDKLQHDINREAAKMPALLSGQSDKYEYLTGDEIVAPDQRRVIEQAKFTYFAFEKQIKAVEDQGEKQIKALK